MKLSKLLLVCSVASGMLMLGACASKHKKSAEDYVASNDTNGNGVQTAGIDAGENFGGSQGQEGNGHLASINKRTYYFDFDRSEVHDDDKPAIVANANKLVENPSKKVIVEGHTDPRGSREYNVALGERRANSVKNLMESSGANTKQIRVVSYGAERLGSTNRDESGYQLDRRAVITN